MSLRKLISKLKYCDSPQSLLQLEDQFNDVGLTVQLAASGKLFLCLIEDGKPAHERLLEDHIPLCQCTGVLDETVKGKIVSFVMENAKGPSQIEKPDKSNSWFYGDSIKKQRGILESDIIEAVAEWLDE